jgi:hypothetical protein
MIDRRATLLGCTNRNSRIIEVGAGYLPVAPKSAGWNSFVVDRAEQAALKSNHKSPNLDTELVEEIDSVWAEGPLSDAVPAALLGQFDTMIASHVLERMPDFVGYLKCAARIMGPHGVIAAALPDKRYCFDFFRPASTTGDFLEAHLQRRTRHSLRTAWDQIAYSAALGGKIGWAPGQTEFPEFVNTFETSALFAESYSGRAAEPYLGFHAWQFTPASFQLVMLELAALGLIDWRVDSIVENATFEFFVFLKRGAERFADGNALQRRRSKLLRDHVAEMRSQFDEILADADEPPAGALRRNEPAPKVQATAVGYIDQLSPRHAAGWGYDPARTDKAIDIEVVLGNGNELLNRGTASLYLPGIETAGAGDGRHGFHFLFPRTLTQAELADVSVRAAGCAGQFERSPRISAEYQPIEYIIMDIVDNCNLRCPFCVYDYRNVHRTNMMSEETIDAAVRLSPYVTEGNFWFSCLHEPTMHPRLMEYVYKVPREQRSKVFYTTNLARRMPDEYFAALAESGMHHVNISIESQNPAIYERMRKGARHAIFQENWDRLTGAFNKAANPPMLRYICLAYKSNFKEIPSLVAYLLQNRLAFIVEVRHTYDVEHIPREFRQSEYMFRDDWIWLRDALAGYSAQQVLLDLPPMVDGLSFDDDLRASLERDVPPAAPQHAKSETAGTAAAGESLPEGFLPHRYGLRVLWDGRTEVNRVWGRTDLPSPGEVRLATIDVRDIGDPLDFLRKLPV